MRTNQEMRGYLSQMQTHESDISPELSNVLVAGFVEEKGCLLLASEVRNYTVAREAALDDTAYECFINHLHIDNLADALEFARRLKNALAERFTGISVVIVSFDGRKATVRFHKLRAGQMWLNKNLEGYLDEGIAVLDSEQALPSEL